MSPDPAKKANKFSIKIIDPGTTSKVSIVLAPIHYYYGDDYDNHTVGFHGENGGISLESDVHNPFSFEDSIVTVHKTSDSLSVGETMSIEVYAKGSETVVRFRRNSDIYYETKLPRRKVYPGDEGEVEEMYPGLVMRSRGAAAKLLSDRFWISESETGFDDIPTLPTWKGGNGLYISIAKKKTKKRMRRGSIYIYNLTGKTVALEVRTKEKSNARSRKCHKCRMFLEWW